MVTYFFQFFVLIYGFIILSLLLQKDKVTSAELAEKFEVSRRTILRDIESINMAGIPIISEQGQGGGISIMKGYKIDRTLLSSDDMQAILSGLQSLDSVSGTNRYRQLMEKISANDTASINADNQIIIDLSRWDKSEVADKIELIKGSRQLRQCCGAPIYREKILLLLTMKHYCLILQIFYLQI